MKIGLSPDLYGRLNGDSFSADWCARKGLEIEPTTPRYQPEHEGWKALSDENTAVFLLGATKLSEQVYCEWLAQHLYRGAGTIVDLGCWLGSLTIPMARGLSRNSHLKGLPQQIIHSYDLFTWDRVMVDWVKNTSLEGKLQEGDCYLETFKELLGPWANSVSAHKTDLTHEKWNGGPIEILVVDAMKNLELTRSISSAFFPSVIPQEGYVLHQDFLWFGDAWIHLLMYRMRHYFEVAYVVPESTTVVFKSRKPLPPEALELPPSLNGFSRGELDDAAIWAHEFAPLESQVMIRAGKGLLLANCGDADAKPILEEALVDPYITVDGLFGLKWWLNLSGIAGRLGLSCRVESV